MRIKLLLGIAVLLGGFSAANAAEKVFPPFGVSSFEGSICGWRFKDHKQSKIAAGKLDNTDAYKGKGSFKIVLTQKPKVYTVLSRTMSVPKGQQLPDGIRLAYKGNAPAKLLVRGYKSDKKWHYNNFVIPASGKWKVFQFQLSWPQSVSQICVELRAEQQGVFQADEIMLLNDMKK